VDELLKVFNELRLKHEGMDEKEFNNDGTYQTGNNEVRPRATQTVKLNQHCGMTFGTVSAGAGPQEGSHHEAECASPATVSSHLPLPVQALRLGLLGCDVLLRCVSQARGCHRLPAADNCRSEGNRVRRVKATGECLAWIQLAQRPHSRLL
jgi:hypothetical protein